MNRRQFVVRTAAVAAVSSPFAGSGSPARANARGMAAADAARCLKPSLPAALDAPIGMRGRVLDGPSFDLEAYRGRPVAMNFFATWCPPCRAEIPDFNALAARFATTGAAAVIGVDVDDADDDVRDLRRKLGISYPIVMDDGGTVFENLGACAFPTTIFFDRFGRIESFFAGSLGADSLNARMDALLAKDLDAPLATPAPRPAAGRRP